MKYRKDITDFIRNEAKKVNKYDNDYYEAIKHEILFYEKDGIIYRGDIDCGRLEGYAYVGNEYGMDIKQRIEDRFSVRCCLPTESHLCWCGNDTFRYSYGQHCIILTCTECNTGRKLDMS